MTFLVFFFRNCRPLTWDDAGTGDTSVFGKETRVREQINQVTSFLDASTVYGSSDEDMEQLRDRLVAHLMSCVQT